MTVQSKKTTLIRTYHSQTLYVLTNLCKENLYIASLLINPYNSLQHYPWNLSSPRLIRQRMRRLWILRPSPFRQDKGDSSGCERTGLCWSRQHSCSWKHKNICVGSDSLLWKGSCWSYRINVCKLRLNVRHVPTVPYVHKKYDSMSYFTLW